MTFKKTKSRTWKCREGNTIAIIDKYQGYRDTTYYLEVYTVDTFGNIEKSICSHKDFYKLNEAKSYARLKLNS